MNKKHYKVIFSQVLNQLVVVSELAKSKGKATSENIESAEIKTTLKATALSTLFGTLTPVHFSIMLALGFVFVSPAALANADMAIRADKSAPGNQQPTVLQTANGLPQVNIQTPSAGGVSRNQYSQFDVAEKGAVLNNARKAVQTQTAGWVQGNPNLAAGEAKVILNEVNSSAPSRLKGYVEVAGQKADVVIANPSGIHCDGCGVINAGRATMTTGKAQLENGELKGYEVNGGKVKVSGKGMDNRQADYTDIIAENAQIDGGVWSKKAIKVTTGKNKVDHTNDSVVYVGDKNTVESDRTLENPQAYSVDVSQLGGMYAEKIHLVDNGQGLGVRNAGHIGASAGEVNIDSQGNIVNTGQIQASGDVNTTAAGGGITNAKGAGIVSRDGAVQVKAKGEIKQDGQILAKQKADVKGDSLTQGGSGEIVGGNVRLEIAGKVVNRGLINARKVEKNDSPAKTLIKSSEVQNIGTGRIYGDNVALGATLIENFDEKNDEGNLASGVIAARERLDLGAKRIVNQSRFYSGNTDDATAILSFGEFNIGSALNENDEAIGKAALLQNRSALMQGKGGKWAVAQIEQTNDFFETELKTVSEKPVDWHYIVPNGESEATFHIDKRLVEWYNSVRGKNGYHVKALPTEIKKPHNGDVVSSLLPPVTICENTDCDIHPETYYLPSDPAWKAFGIHTQQRANVERILSQAKVPVAPTKPTEPANLASLDEAAKVAYQAQLNDYEQALASYQAAKAEFDEKIKPLYVQWMKDNPMQFKALSNKIEQHNAAIAAYAGRNIENFWETNVNKEVTRATTVTKTQPGKIVMDGELTVDSDNFTNDKSQVLSGGALRLLHAQIDNINAQGEQYTDLYGDKRYAYLRKRKSKSSSGRNKYDRRYSGYTAGWLSTDKKTITLPVANVFTDYAFESNELANQDNKGMNVPTSSLYKINPQSDNQVLIETDPQFTDRNKWLSSDYMFKMLRADPQNMLKRLGDGYYEQQQVRNQLNHLTGRPQDSRYASFEAQYKALMDNAVSVAQQFHLTPGVALSAEQVKALTTDIVWFEPQTVTLKDGTQQKVLAPKVYLSKFTRDNLQKEGIDGSATLISAEKVLIETNKTVNNQGQIAARSQTVVQAGNIQNDGKITAKQTALFADNHIEGSGRFEAEEALLLNAKAITLNSTTATGEVNRGDYSHRTTKIDRQAALYVKGENGSLTVAAENIALNAVNLINEGKGKTQLHATQNLDLGTVSEETEQRLGGNSNHRKHEKNSAAQATRIHTQGDAVLSAKNIHTQGGELQAKGALRLHATENLTLGTKTDTAALEEYHKDKTKRIGGSESRESYVNLQGEIQQGTQLHGQTVTTTAGRDLTAVATQALAAENIALSAGGKLNVEAAVNREQRTEWDKHKKSGLTGSVKNSTARVGYGRSSENLDAKGYDETVVGSQFVAEKGKLTLNAQEDVNVNASQLVSGGDMLLSGKNVNLNAVNEQHESEQHRRYTSSGIGMGVVYDPVGKARDNYREKEAQGSAKTYVGKNLTASEAVTDSLEATLRGVQPYFRHQRGESHQVGQKTLAKTTALEAGGKLSIEAREGDIRTQGSRISAEGDAQFIAKNNVDFGVAVHTQSQQASTKSGGFSLDGTAKYVAGVNAQRERGETELQQEVGSTISVGGKATTIAQQGDITLKGTAFVAGGQNRLQANEGNVSLTTSQTTEQGSQSRKGHAVGEAVISETERFFGYNRTRMNQDGESTNHRGSNLTSLNSVVSVYAGKDYHQTASEVLAKEKADISAQHITIDNAINHQANSQSESDLKIGQFTRVKSPIIDLLNTIESAVKNDRASDRLQAANAMSMAAQGYSVYNAVNKMITKDPKSNTYLFRVESGTGVAHSRQSQEGLADISVGSRINAKDINLIARGDDNQKANEKGERQLGRINLTHTDLTSRDEQGKRIQDSRITLTGNKLNIQAGESHTQFKGRNQSVGVEVGMAAQVGAQTGVGVYARVGGSSGKEDGESKTYQASHLDAQTVTLNSQGDTNLLGSQVKGNTVNANVGGKLNIESLQDEERFKTKSSGGGLEVEFGFGNNWSVSGYGNASKGTTHRKQVNEQAGIFAEEGGYHINADSVHLKGGSIASTNAQNSILQTNTLTFEDIQNESSSKAASASISGSIKESKEKWVDNETGEKVKPHSPNSTFIPSQRSGGLSPGLPMLQQSSDSSTTKATLTEGTVILNKDTSPTQTTAAQLGINTDLAQANNQVAQTKDVKAQLQEQQQIAAAIGNVKSAVDTYISNKLNEAETAERRVKAEYDKAKANNASKDALDFLEYRLKEAKREVGEWGYGGGNRRTIDTVTALFTGVLSGQGASATAVATLSPTVNKLIADNTHDKATNALAHAVWGAIEAQVNGGSAAHGAISAAGAELLAPKIASILYGKSEADLTPDEKAGVISMASLAGGIAGALMNGKSEGVEIIGNATINAQIAENTVTNNYLSGWQEKQRDEELAACNGSLRCELKTGVYWELVSAGQDTAYGAGLATSIPEGLFETGKGIAEIAMHPIDSLNAIRTLIQEGNFTEAMKQSYANRIDKMIVEYQKAGAEGAFKAGLEAGQLLQETVGILAGGAGLAKVGAKFTKAVVTFAKGEKTAVAVVKGSASSTASDIASNTLETVKNSRVKALTCSFRGDMEVKTEQGYKPIESIKVGDKVYAKNELTGQMTYQRVQAHYNNPYDFTVYVEVIDEQGKHQTIVSNKIHPFFTQVNQGELVPSSEGHHYNGEIQNAQWVDAQNLKAGYKLLSENNHWQTVKGVSIKAEKLSAYNLTVETDHTYFIKGANSDLDGVWVHNDCWHALPDGAKRIKDIDGYHAYKFKNQDGKEITVIKKDLNRFETVNHNAGTDPHFNRLSQRIDEQTGRYLSTDKPVDQFYNRSYLRSDTMKKIFEQYEALPNGNYRDKITRAIIKGPIDIGHAYGWEHRRLSLAAKELNWSQKQFNDYVNARPNKFRLENMSENRSHRNEMPGRDDIERIVRDMKNFERGK